MFLKNVIYCIFTLLVEFPRKVSNNDETHSVQSQLFIDKTSLIPLVFKRNVYTVLVTAPKGFGKTTNMDMIRRFCEIQVNEEGKVISRNNTKYFQIFSSLYTKDNILSFLDVYQDKVFFHNVFAQYPVIHMDFSQLDFKSWNKFKNSLVKIINNIYNYHRYLLSSDMFSDREKVMFRNYQFGVICKELGLDQLKRSFNILALMLEKYFRQKVVLLLDEVDSVMHSQLMHSCDDMKEITIFNADFISYILNSTSIAKAVLNSCSRLTRAFIQSDKNIDHFIFGEKHPFHQYYGFNENEVIYLAEIFNLKNNITTIRDWYNGYKITNSDLKMYSFSSISNVMSRKDIDVYTKKVNYPEMFENLLLRKPIRMKIKMLIKNEVVHVGAVKEVSVKDVFMLKELFVNAYKFDVLPRAGILLFDYMLNLGYFTKDGFNEDGSKVRLKVPNKETKSELMDLTYSMQYFKTKLNLTDDEILSMNETVLDSKMSMIFKEPTLTPSS